MFSLTSTGTCRRPLWTAIVNPTISGSTMERRDQVLIGRLLFCATASSTFLIRWWSTKGPFRIERGTCSTSPCLLASATSDDHRVGPLVLACLMTLGRHAPRRHRVTPAGGTAFAAAVRMIDRVHDHAANGRPHTAPARSTGLAELAQTVLAVADLADDGATIDMDLAHLPGAQTQGRALAVARHELGGATCGPCQLGTLAGTHLDAVHLGADRNVAQRHAVADADRRGLAGLDTPADSKALRGNDVGTLAVGKLQQRQMGGAVRVVLEPFDDRRDPFLVALEVDKPIVLLVSAALVTHRDAAEVVAPAMLRLFLDERRVGRALVKLGRRHLDDETTSGGRRFGLYDCHLGLSAAVGRPVQAPPPKSIS
ncbi:conserved hypothetical protein [Thiocapsa sp. KS1]|nr:conserved hypothetical protein [Thiocapsa sp. KS1]